ncbi:MAG TPA: MBL fold metallo-hydrolase [bacterium]|nr:MBL fold metallo-hydrolase [bacterium]
MLKAGQYEVYILETGRFALDAGVVFGLIPKALWSKKIETDSKNRMEMALRSILIKSDDRKILVETGAGNLLGDKMRQIYKVDYTNYSLEKALQNIGLDFEDITDVINTHLHFDHCGGNVIRENGQIQPAFPNATYYVQKDHYNWVQSPSILDRNSFLPLNYKSLYDDGLLKLIDGPEEIFPGIESLISNGHTPGQQHVLINDDQQPVFFCADLFPLHYNVKTTWISSLELFPVDFVKEKKEIVQKAWEGNWRVIYPHDPKVKISRIKKLGAKYKAFEPNLDSPFN